MSVLLLAELDESHGGAPRQQRRGVTARESQGHPGERGSVHKGKPGAPGCSMIVSSA